ncbi:uncharacterized protein LOC126576878 [Anopheles aquasalis]|uniref:uncharacterized protein LOC126576878 n=1 Tax=Anopheles aquasalis TaxID=42839 RepID=UPI00215A599E|nr:uncharacterized protein LOC126576878 [Anopheles aquasalis]
MKLRRVAGTAVGWCAVWLAAVAVEAAFVPTDVQFREPTNLISPKNPSRMCQTLCGRCNCGGQLLSETVCQCTCDNLMENEEVRSCTARMQFLCNQMDVQCDIKPSVNETTLRVPRGSDEGYEDVNYNYGYEGDYGYHEEEPEDEGHHKKKWKHKHKGKHKHKHKKQKYSKFRIVIKGKVPNLCDHGEGESHGGHEEHEEYRAAPLEHGPVYGPHPPPDIPPWMKPKKPTKPKNFRRPQPFGRQRINAQPRPQHLPGPIDEPPPQDLPSDPELHPDHPSGPPEPPPELPSNRDSEESQDPPPEAFPEVPEMHFHPPPRRIETSRSFEKPAYSDCHFGRHDSPQQPRYYQPPPPPPPPPPPSYHGSYTRAHFYDLPSHHHSSFSYYAPQEEYKPARKHLVGSPEPSYYHDEHSNHDADGHYHHHHHHSDHGYASHHYYHEIDPFAENDPNDWASSSAPDRDLFTFNQLVSRQIWLNQRAELYATDPFQPTPRPLRDEFEAPSEGNGPGEYENDGPVEKEPSPLHPPEDAFIYPVPPPASPVENPTAEHRPLTYDVAEVMVYPTVTPPPHYLKVQAAKGFDPLPGRDPFNPYAPYDGHYDSYLRPYRSRSR